MTVKEAMEAGRQCPPPGAEVLYYPGDPAVSGRWEFYAVTAEKAGLCRCWVHLLDSAVAVSSDLRSPAEVERWMEETLARLASACRYALSVIGEGPREQGQAQEQEQAPGARFTCKHFDSPHLRTVMSGNCKLGGRNDV